MPLSRLLLVWFVMLAIPLQGVAGASMLFCGPGAAHHAVAGQHAHEPGTPAHDHARHQADAAPAQHAGAGGMDAGIGADMMHTCSLCASCCSAVALTQTPLAAWSERPARAGPPEPLVAAYSRPSRVPDKPPRA